MKKFFLATALATAALAASAADITGTVKYDYDRYEGSPYTSVHAVTSSVKAGFGAYGAVDGGLVAGQVVLNDRHNGFGYSLGYTNGVKLGPVTASARVGYRHVEFDNFNANTTSLYVQGALPVNDKVSAVAGYERQVTALSSASASGTVTADRFTAGAKLALSQRVDVSLLAARMRSEGRDSNGLTTAVSYKF